MGEKHNQIRDQYWADSWKKCGTLIREFHIVKSTEKQGKRAIDGVIVLDGNPHRMDCSVTHGQYNKQNPDQCIQNEKVVVLQVMRGRLGMYLLGQALFSRVLMVRNGYKVKETVAVCEEDDEVLRPIAEEYGITVVPMNE